MTTLGFDDYVEVGGCVRLATQHGMVVSGRGDARRGERPPALRHQQARPLHSSTAAPAPTPCHPLCCPPPPPRPQPLKAYLSKFREAEKAALAASAKAKRQPAEPTDD